MDIPSTNTIARNGDRPLTKQDSRFVFEQETTRKGVEHGCVVLKLFFVTGSSYQRKSLRLHLQRGTSIHYLAQHHGRSQSK